ncbi:MAG: RNA pseudouridine synthase [Spirochaetaceae bacterium]|nr:MAG: RNA pseudouridine synthase [Spirochaetaceae bacterium]
MEQKTPLTLHLPTMGTLIYLDSWLAIVAKEAGEPVQTRDSSLKTVVQELRANLGDSRLQPVHRIDQPVSGAVIFARSGEIFSTIHGAIGRGELHRAYLAVVSTPPEPAQGVLRDHLMVPGDSGASGPRTRRTRVVHSDTEGSRQAVLRYETLGRSDHHTVILVELETGRHHQIRAQLAHRGWHVVGDALYGARRPMRDRSIALHAWYVSVPHPVLPDRITCTADLPATALWKGVGRLL